MSKAVAGAALLAGSAIALGVLTGGFSFVGLMALSTTSLNILGGIALGGLSMEAGAIAGALTSNRGQNITTRQVAGFRQRGYGTQRVGGTAIYRSTTGSHRDQYNLVVAVYDHESWGIDALYLDGRQVYFDNGVGTTTRNGITFGGAADGNDHIGPDGSTYNFGGKVYCEACYGDQTALPNTTPGGGFNTGLQANDPTWSPGLNVIPYVAGCTYFYLKFENDPTLFPGDPEIRITIKGKPVYDPRTGTTGYSHNWALICNDVLTDPLFGLEESVNQEQLIAAANVCDEAAPLAAGGSEDRYAAHWHFDSSVGAGDVLATFMSAAAGRASFIGGEWYLWPAYYQGPSASFDASAITSPLKWSDTRSYKDLFNRVTGTYTAPNYPYNPTGDLYDSNGWYEGRIQNNFQFAYQSTNFPQYACDTEHGYPADEYFLEDGSTPLTKELSLPCVMSVAQAQRLAKIELMRNRQQGTGSWEMSLEAFQMQPADTYYQTFAANGWANKIFELNSAHFKLEGGGHGEAPKIVFQVGVNETDPSVYEWSTSEELTIYDVPAAAQQTSNTVAPPTNLSLTSSAATALKAADGVVYPRIQVQWDTPLDGFVTQIQLQYQLAGALTWTDGGLADVSLNLAYLAPVIGGLEYSVRIRSLRANGAVSVWVELDGFTPGLVLSVLTQNAIGQGSLVGEGFSDGTAGIICEPFSAPLGGKIVSYLPSGEVNLTGLVQQRVYWVYLVDLTLSGGDLTPVATLNQADYLGKLGYFLIGTVSTPFAAAPGGVTTTRYEPTMYQDRGTRTVQNPTFVFDGDTSNAATISSAANSSTSTSGDLFVNGFANVAVPAATTLYVYFANVSVLGASSTASLVITVNGTITGVDFTTLTSSPYTQTIPANTPLASISVEINADAETTMSGSATIGGKVSIDINEIYIQ